MMFLFKKKSRSIAIFLFLFFLIFYFFYFLYLPVDKGFTEKVFKIEKGKSPFQIAENLEKQGLVKNKFIFTSYLILTGKYNKVQAGYYFLNSSMNIPKIVKKIVLGETAKIKITIPEGFTILQIEEKIGLKLPGENLQGFLFPDTYQLAFGFSGEEMNKKMRDGFEKKLTPDLREKIKKQNKTIFEIITMASLIEKEVRTFKDKKMISGILWKRLKIDMPLQVDVAIETYQKIGLPENPICNPGMESILAAIYPEDNEYWYYLSTFEGETIFSKTLEQHNKAKAKYLK
ncbi:hypothetical protein COY61_01455 [bacterium (Candidatus Gribaldobacteria) CG_4_10_14_0_8_um_filter_33_9]|uniref:Endolytic murein transglycosylase n=1 Tax=bacterium (Candidatus Gribaldobacteria) CG_4_10_14_0_8_um_filter_33_9 TaxID=2014266 RepID=A0A2M7RMY0_9BACT|nr:MAG: hypothetical protein COY61_01455 [bacterium (Candidatus Gribaldobacteria) CG_4_10_14_0_8_um_filter_33_9]